MSDLDTAERFAQVSLQVMRGLLAKPATTGHCLFVPSMWMFSDRDAVGFLSRQPKPICCIPVRYQRHLAIIHYPLARGSNTPAAARVGSTAEFFRQHRKNGVPSRGLFANASERLTLSFDDYTDWSLDYQVPLSSFLLKDTTGADTEVAQFKHIQIDESDTESKISGTDQ